MNQRLTYGYRPPTTANVSARGDYFWWKSTDPADTEGGRVLKVTPAGSTCVRCVSPWTGAMVDVEELGGEWAGPIQRPDNE